LPRAHFLNQARLSDPRLAAHVDDLPTSPRNRCRQYAFELVKFRHSSDKGAAVSWRCVGRQAD